MENRVFKVEKLVHGGMGIVRDGRRAIFVPFVIPGEEIKIRLETGGRIIRALIKEVVSASPDRVEPPCPLFGQCGGCQFQHISYPAQLRFKLEILYECLFWIAKIKPEIGPFRPSPRPYNYRSRIRMHVQGSRAGFFARDKKKFLPVEYCYITHDEINQAIPALPSLIKRDEPETIELILEGESLVAVSSRRRSKGIYRMLPGSGKGGGEWIPTPGRMIAFQQVNPEQNEALRKSLSRAVNAIRPAGVIELYAGTGNFTEVILPHSSWIMAVDADKAAVELAMNKFKNNKLKFVNKKAFEFVTSAFEEGLKPDLIVLDPPRTGAKDAIPGIIRLKPQHIIHISCDPATLARDLKELLSRGYRLESVEPVDMFPQTSHIETVAVLSRT